MKSFTQLAQAAYEAGEKVLGEQHGRAVHFERTHHEEGGAGPDGHQAECSHRPAGPITDPAHAERRESGEEND